MYIINFTALLFRSYVIAFCIPAFQRIDFSNSSNASLSKSILKYSLSLASTIANNPDWNTAITNALTKSLNRAYIDNVLVECVLASEDKSGFSKAILEQAKLHLQERVNNKPQPSADWSRPIPKVDYGYKKVWAILADFLSSLTQQVSDYARVLSDRSTMESALLNVKIDIRTETIKRDRHILCA
jgi:hypothetical protein